MFLNLIKAGGITMIPLAILAIISTAIFIDKIIFYQKLVKIPQELVDLIEKYNFDWNLLKNNLKQLPAQNCYRQFFEAIVEIQDQKSSPKQINQEIPVWWIESRTNDQAKIIEKKLNSSLWLLETIITASPLLGLLGTIIGMMSSFKIIGNSTIINPTLVSAGVAESLIATGFGLLIAIIALFAFNYFSRLQNQTLDEMERLATKLIDHIKIDRKIID
ncbi:MAG: MotA/TolQ/ExbB proton channel family protein [Alphaproteobacteria bacterium]